MRADQRRVVPGAAQEYDGTVACPTHLGVRLGLTWLWYQMRLLGGWLFLLAALGFVCAGFLAWLQVHLGGAAGLQRAADVCRFVMEPGAGLLAAMLASSLVVGDPLLEVTLPTPTGIVRVAAVRALLAFVLLALCSAGFLLWSLAGGISYTGHETLLFLLLMWLAPVLVMGLLGLLGALATRNAALGMVLAAVPLAASLFLYPALLRLKALHPFLLTYTFSGGYDASDWLTNRLVLLGCALVLAVAVGWLLLREERLLAASR